MIEQKTVKIINTQKMMNEYTTEELHSIIGNFEKEYNEAATGDQVSNDILGYVKQGIVNQALRIGAIIKQGEVYFVKLPEYREYDLKLRALRELISRRSYAREKNNPLN